MAGIPVDIAVEDELSEVVVRKVLLESTKVFHIGTTYRRGGYGYLRKTINGWNAAAKGKPFVVLTDLDDAECPATLIGNWLKFEPNRNLIFRVAVRKVEAWLLADNRNLAKFLRVPERYMPREPEALRDPKATLIELAERSRFRYIRDSLLPRQGSTAKQGRGYNECLGGFVREYWDWREASSRAASLAKALERFERFEPVWATDEG